MRHDCGGGDGRGSGSARYVAGVSTGGAECAKSHRVGQDFSETKFSVVVDDATAIADLEQAFANSHSTAIEVLLDLDVGQHRTGIASGPKAVELYRRLASCKRIKPGGLHAYDGHIS